MPREIVHVGRRIRVAVDTSVGPNGETVVYVLNKDNKEKQPTELMTLFKAKRGS